MPTLFSIGFQYNSYAFKDLLDKYKIIQSMSRSGNPYDNAVAKIFQHCIFLHRRLLQLYCPYFC